MHPPIALQAAFRSLPTLKYRHTLYRTILPRFSSTPLSGAGAMLRGSRFTPRGSFEALYLAEDPQTAFIEYQHESLALARDMDDDFAVRLPVIATLAPHVILEADQILDLLRHEVRIALGTDLNELAAPWRIRPGAVMAPTQVLGQEAHASGRFQAIRYPSARNPGSVCLAVFLDRLVPGGGAMIDLDDSRNGGPVQKLP